MPVESWFVEKWRDGVTQRLSSNGGYLDGTMVTGENVAGTVKFAVSGGEIVMYKLSGAIEEVRPQGISIDMVPVQASDYTAEATIRNQDTARMSAPYQSEVADAMAKSVRNKRDDLKLDALNTFATVGATTLTDAPSAVVTIGDGSARIDPLVASNAVAQMRGAGGEEECYWAIPYMWFDQLDWYQEFKNKDYQGDKDLPMAKSSLVRLKTWRSVHIIALPDRYFRFGTAAYVKGQANWDDTKYLDTFMWSKKAVGCETFWSKEQMNMREWVGKAGTPILCDVALSGAAIGLLPEAVKRIRMKAIKDIVRPT
ncbi:hypothetical protein HF272_13740 [Rhizobium leguminosarum]|uniref:phage capsid protein n=1 Tax=Rhizobium leguminosarum TaxID=384 RepID=UPI001C920939|nr:phage capsid protein [Rhizobium leguminosarum]MBY2992492.1 hypothetical protein [Rhizobium leguminosarum]